MFIRGLIRAYIAWVEVHLCLRAKVPGELIDRLPAVEQIVTSTLWFMLVAPEILDTRKSERRASSTQAIVRAPLILTESELRRRLAKLKAILKDPSGEIARLKAIAAARNIAPARRAIQRPANLILIPYEKICATPARAPRSCRKPGRRHQKPNRKTQFRRTSPAGPAARAGGCPETRLTKHRWRPFLPALPGHDAPMPRAPLRAALHTPRARRAAGALAALMALAILIVCLMPGSDLPKVRLTDKIQHFIAYAALSVPLCVALGPRRIAFAFCLAAAYGGFVELAQALVPTGRSASWLDGLANAIGAALGCGVMAFLVFARKPDL